MNSRFVLPASVAAAMHLAAFFAYTPTPSARPMVPPEKPSPVDERDLVALTPESPEPAEADDNPTRLPQGDTQLRPPVGDEPPPMDHPPVEIITETFPPAIPSSGVITSHVPGIYGVPDGIPGGDPHPGPTIIDASKLDHQPQARSRIAPVYPHAAGADAREGEVFVEFMVDETGSVRDARVVRSSNRIFEEPTLRAVERWRFEPGRKNGRVVRFRMAVPVVFHRVD